MNDSPLAIRLTEDASCLGTRREGSFFAMSGFVVRMGVGHPRDLQN